MNNYLKIKIFYGTRFNFIIKNEKNINVNNNVGDVENARCEVWVAS